MVVSLCGFLVCADDAEDAVVREHLARHLELTRAEPGCLEFTVEPAAERLCWRVEERFADPAAFRAHQARVAASDWGTATSGIARHYEVTGLD